MYHGYCLSYPPLVPFRHPTPPLRQHMLSAVMYASSLRRVGSATRPRGKNRSRLPRPICSNEAPLPLLRDKSGVRGLSSSANSASAAPAGGGAEPAWQRARVLLAGFARVPSASSVAGAVALVPVVGGAWLVTVYALRQRLCEDHLQQVG